jgi:hypothetical protein
MQQILQRRSSVSCTTRNLAEGTGDRRTGFCAHDTPRFAGCLPPPARRIKNPFIYRLYAYCWHKPASQTTSPPCSKSLHAHGLESAYTSRGVPEAEALRTRYARISQDVVLKEILFAPSRISFVAKQQSFIRKRPSVASGVAEEACLMRVRWLRPESAAATKVPPEPTNGSSTTPAGQNDSTSGQRMPTAFSCRALHRRLAAAARNISGT